MNQIPILNVICCRLWNNTLTVNNLKNINSSLVHVAFPAGSAFYFVIQTAYFLYAFLNLEQFFSAVSKLVWYSDDKSPWTDKIQHIKYLVCWDLVYFGHNKGCCRDSNFCCLTWHALKAVDFFPCLLPLLLIFMQCCIVRASSTKSSIFRPYNLV
jgi:hypothetical protein